MQGLLARLRSLAHYRGQQPGWAQVFNPAPYLTRLLTFLGSLMRGHPTPTLSGIFGDSMGPWCLLGAFGSQVTVSPIYSS